MTFTDEMSLHENTNYPSQKSDALCGSHLCSDGIATRRIDSTMKRNASQPKLSDGVNEEWMIKTGPTSIHHTRLPTSMLTAVSSTIRAV